jgi:hypothetical protein
MAHIYIYLYIYIYFYIYLIYLLKMVIFHSYFDITRRYTLWIPPLILPKLVNLVNTGNSLRVVLDLLRHAVALFFRAWRLHPKPSNSTSLMSDWVISIRPEKSGHSSVVWGWFFAWLNHIFHPIPFPWWVPPSIIHPGHISGFLCPHFSLTSPLPSGYD